MPEPACTTSVLTIEMTLRTNLSDHADGIEPFRGVAACLGFDADQGAADRSGFGSSGLWLLIRPATRVCWAMSAGVEHTRSGADASSGQASKSFIALMVGCISAVALSIDLLLPAFPEIRDRYGMAEDATTVSWVVTAFFLGMAIGPWFFGPASDRFGRRPPMAVGLVIYIVAAFGSVFAPTFGVFIALRVLWGIGAAAPAAIATAMVRDLFEGNEMARVMSMVMAAFMLVPAVAPSIGTVIIAVLPWQSLLVLQAAFGVVLLVWSRRMPETLRPEHRRPFTWRSLGSAARVVLTTRQTLALTLATMLFMGMMTGYLGSIELILDDIYDAAYLFPIMFATNAILQAGSSLNNARVVRSLGLVVLIRRLSVAGCLSTGALAVVSVISNGQPNIVVLWIGLAAVLVVVQNLFPTCSAGAMLPVPAIAGTASAIMSTMTTAGGALIGAVVSGQINESVQPLALWLFGLAIGSFVLTTIAAGRGRTFVSADGPNAKAVAATMLH